MLSRQLFKQAAKEETKHAARGAASVCVVSSIVAYLSY